MSRKLPVIGILINFLAIVACISTFVSIHDMGSLSLPPEDHEMMIKKIKSSNDVEKLRKFSLEAQQIREIGSKVLNNQIDVLKEIVGYALLFSSLNAGCFFLISRRIKKTEA